jgi:predicted nucleic acid-binding Zn ribbon protein
MNLRDPQPSNLGDILHGYLRHKGYSRHGAEVLAAVLWAETVGPWYAQHTEVVRVEKGVLTVHCDSAPLAQQLTADSDKILARLNQKVADHLGPGGTGVPPVSAPPGPGGAGVSPVSAPPAPGGTGVSPVSAPPGPGGTGVPPVSAPPGPGGTGVSPVSEPPQFIREIRAGSAHQGRGGGRYQPEPAPPRRTAPGEVAAFSLTLEEEAHAQELAAPIGDEQLRRRFLAALRASLRLRHWHCAQGWQPCPDCDCLLPPDEPVCLFCHPPESPDQVRS